MRESEALLCPVREGEAENEKKRILFVCTGNTCRSPMAAALFNHIYMDDERYALSAGLAADGSPISEHACEVLMERGVLPTKENDYPNHVSRPADGALAASADMIIGLTASHATALMLRYPEFATKIYALPADIPDPYGGSIDDYRRCLEKIEKALSEVFSPVKGSDNTDSFESTDCSDGTDSTDSSGEHGQK